MPYGNWQHLSTYPSGLPYPISSPPDYSGWILINYNPTSFTKNQFEDKINGWVVKTQAKVKNTEENLDKFKQEVREWKKTFKQQSIHQKEDIYCVYNNIKDILTLFKGHMNIVEIYYNVLEKRIDGMKGKCVHKKPTKVEKRATRRNMKRKANTTPMKAMTKN
uniref:Uncharacterized protein n=1 Tax=Pseudocercospora fijiensis TaxID=1873960 RepID=A0A516EZM9_9PEZI|nr:hypothetical protein [Pseudocercospora fijiensis]QDO71959.1 hypothetical protein [Pseudocercospora fijiensis]